ncbi:MAG TPA: hypothetical protein VJ773_07975, partial [Gemmatimonadales bacterium]|nr:hypothetical protein [Gemmatimonadales bacterium]
MPSAVYRRLQELLGEPAVDADATGTPRAFPDGIERACGVLALAHAEGWRVRLEGRATWMPADAPADLVLSTAALVGVLPPDRERGLVRA